MVLAYLSNIKGLLLHELTQAWAMYSVPLVYMSFLCRYNAPFTSMVIKLNVLCDKPSKIALLSQHHVSYSESFMILYAF